VDRLAEYVDNLLAPGDRAAVEGHLGACPGCRAAAVKERCARTALREQARALTATPLPPSLRTRCEALARSHAARSQPSTLLRRSLAPLTTLAGLAAALLLFSIATHRSDTVLAAQLTADHAKCFRLFGSEQSEADPRRIEQMLQDDYGWTFHIPRSSSSEGIYLMGARRCLYADGWVPHVMYRVGTRHVSLYRLDGVARSNADVITLGHRSHIWARDGATYALVWPEEAGDMTATVRYVVAQAR
jgi:hypothetical protein